MALAADYQVVVNGDAQRLGRGLLAPLVPLHSDYDSLAGSG